MSIASILVDTNNPGAEPEIWADLNVQSLKTKDLITDTFSVSDISTDNIIADDIITNSLVVNSDIVTNSIVVSDSIEIAGFYVIGSLDAFRAHGYVSDGNMTINLHDNESYMFPKIVDIGPYSINCGTNNCLFGPGIEQGGLRSTGLSDTLYMINSNHTLTIHDCAFYADEARDQNCIKLISSDGTMALDWYNCNFYNWGSSTGENTLLLDGAANCIWDTLGFIGSSNINFQTTTYSTGTVGIMNAIFQPKTGTDSINIDSSFNCLRRFRASYSAFISAGGSSTSINAASDAGLPSNGFILDTCNFSGAGTAVANIDNIDNRSLWTNNVGITNTATNGELIMINNTSDTVISNTSDYYHVAGVGFAGDFNQRFIIPASSDNVLQYTGSISFPVKALIAGSLNSGNNNQIDIGLRKNGVLVNNSLSTNTTDGGGRLNSIASFGITTLSSSDYFDIVVRNRSSTNNVRVDKLHVLISEL